jgi:hypothetical protein
MSEQPAANPRPRLVLGETWLMNNVEGREYVGNVVRLRKGPRVQGKPWCTMDDPDFLAEVKELEPGDLVSMLPCYMLSIGEQTGPQGQPVLGAIVMPYALFGMAQPVTMPLSVVSFMGELDPSDLHMVKDWVKQAETTRTQVRAARAGLAVPTR